MTDQSYSDYVGVCDTWDDYRAELEKLARNNLRVAKRSDRRGAGWAVISLTEFWEQGDETDVPCVMANGFQSKRAAEMRLESYVENFTELKRSYKFGSSPWDRGSFVDDGYFNQMAQKEKERERQLTVLRKAGVEDPDAVLDAIVPKATDTFPSASDLDAEIPFQATGTMISGAIMLDGRWWTVIDAASRSGVPELRAQDALENLVADGTAW